MLALLLCIKVISFNERILDMLKPITSQILQHLTKQNSWSRKHLAPYAGSVIQLNITPVKTALLILEDGSLGIPTDNSVPDATIHIAPSLALRLLAKDEAAKMLIKVDGDTQLAAEVGKVLQLMRWDIEEDLSQVIGDIPANKTVSVAKHALSEAKTQATNIAEMFAEYWQEEQPLLAKKWRVKAFNEAVDTLRSDVARFEKQLEKLSQKARESVAE